MNCPDCGGDSGVLCTRTLSDTNIDGTNFDGEKVVSDYDKSFVYEVGKTISVNNFNDNRWEECSEGIHFFLTREEAVRY